MICNMGTVRRYHAHKYTAKCPMCNYTSRIPNSDVELTNKNSVHSKTCPKHRVALVRVIYEPKVKNKQLATPQQIREFREKLQKN